MTTRSDAPAPNNPNSDTDPDNDGDNEDHTDDQGAMANEVPFPMEHHPRVTNRNY